MDELLAADPSAGPAGPEAALLEQASARYVGRWNRLVSTTNWEKGRIISEWRNSLIESGVPPQSYSDESWSRRVGNVSPQHVGRLRRVYDRFGGAHKPYRGLCWSHFQAALDWPDAEMWLEGAVRNRWSVAQMRTTRWEALGAPAHKKPKPEEVIVAELDEDIDPALDEATRETLGQSLGVVQALLSHDAPQAEGFDIPTSAKSGRSAYETTTLKPFRTFEDLPPLPDDLAAAFEAMRLAILNHKLSGWQEISRRQVLAALGALRQLVFAPSEG